jgi:hypothetical protein
MDTMNEVLMVEKDINYVVDASQQQPMGGNNNYVPFQQQQGGGGPAAYGVRAHNLLPGRFITSALFDADDIKCLYCCSAGFCCGGTEPIFGRTYLDVYENRIEQNLPWASSCCWGCCCNVYRDKGIVVHFDRDVFDKPVNKAGCCDPFPHFCPHCCGCCGDVLAVNYKCACCPLGTSNTMNPIGHSIMPFLCCWASALTFGLSDGEADRLSQTINAAVASHRSQLAGNCYRPLSMQ